MHIKELLSLLRIQQWFKSIFVLLGFIYSGSSAYFGDALGAVIAFCCMASVVYIYNDVQDLAQDRLHPYKCQRPLASKNISLKSASILLIILLLISLLIAGHISNIFLLILLIYLLINLAYNYKLKNIPLLDVLCVASGFLLRVIAGTFGIGLPMSLWLLSTVTLVSLCITLCKRRLEKKMNLQFITREVLNKYSYYLLDVTISISAISCFITYSIYTFCYHFNSVCFLLTLPVAAFGLYRFINLVKLVPVNGENKVIDDPFILFYQDNISYLNGLCFFILTISAILMDKMIA